MRVEVVVPQIGEAVSELTLVTWHKQRGDTVKSGDVLFEIDSDKAIVEVEAYVDGTLVEVLSGDGSSVMPRDIVGVIETEAVDAAAELAAPSPHEEAPAAPAIDAVDGNGKRVSPVAQRMASEMGVDVASITGSGPRGRIIATDIQRHLQPDVRPAAVGRVNASPKAKRLAREWGVDLSQLTGTGVDGMIRVLDVESARPAVSAPAAPAPVVPAPAGTAAALSKLRQTVALRTQQSKQQVPHFYLMVDVNMSQAKALRSYCVDTAGWERPPTYTAILLRACALALSEFPWANQSYHNQALVSRESVHIGVAVDTAEGLMAPVIRDVKQLNLRQTSENLRDMAQRAQSGRLKPTDMGEKSMTLSNLGMYSVDQFIAIIDQPDPMILAVGRIADRVVPLDGQVSIQPMCTLTLSVDHRVLDGAQGAKFLERVKSCLENPYQILG